jgi:hypothetical protein
VIFSSHSVSPSFSNLLACLYILWRLLYTISLTGAPRAMMVLKLVHLILAVSELLEHSVQLALVRGTLLHA